MYIVRWLMSHPIIAAWMLAGLAILLNFDSGSSHKKDEHVATTDSSHVEQHQEKTTVVDGSVAALAPSPENTPANNAVAIEKAGVEHAATTENNAVEQNLTQASGSMKVAETGASTEAGNKSAEQGAIPTHELLQQARLAYQNGDLNGSVAAYQQLIKAVPNSIEYKGELGNVYYHQNKQKESATIYAEISIALIDQGKSGQVGNMLGFIEAFYPDKAAEISQYMAAHK